MRGDRPATRPATASSAEPRARRPHGGRHARADGRRPRHAAPRAGRQACRAGAVPGGRRRQPALAAAWFFDRLAEIERRTLPHLPQRFLAECDALAQAAGVSRRDGRAANLFPERFHCSGVAVRGKATAGGKVLHARVLDYMRDIRLQDAAVVTVFMPEGRNAWVSLGYAGFIGTVTAMNEKGLAVGEMGGRGEGDWDGMPMSFLLRDMMERAANGRGGPGDPPPHAADLRVLLRAQRQVAGRWPPCIATPRQMTVLRPGQQHPRLPHVPEDTVLISGGDRAEDPQPAAPAALRQDRRRHADRDHQAAGGHEQQPARRDLLPRDAGLVVRRRRPRHARLRRALRAASISAN